MAAHPPRLRFGVFEIDVKAGELWKHGRRIRLQEQPYRVLLALLAVPGETVTRQELRERLWPAETFVDFDNGLNNVINRLRAALGDSATSPRLIETVGRRGYRFIGELDQPVHAEPQPVQHVATPIEPGETVAQTVTDAPETKPDDRGEILASSIGLAAVPAVSDEPHPLAATPAAVLSPLPVTSTRWGFLGASLAAGLIIVAGAIGLAGPARLGSWLGGYGLGTALNASPGIRSLGILPLAEPADSPGGLFAYGMVNAVIAELSRFQALRVVSPTSEGGYQDPPDKSPRQLAAELGVDTLLRGSVTRTDEHIGVSLELIDGGTGRQLWTQSFSRATEDLLALRGDVVRDVVQQVQTRLTPTLEAPAPERVTSNTRAYEAYLRGQFETLRRNPKAFSRAVNFFSYALSLDADYAPAHAGLAWARLQQSNWAGNDHPRAHIEEVRAAISKALYLDPNLSEAHVALSLQSRFYNWDWVGAEAALKRAIQLKPSSAMAHNEYTRLLLCMGRFAEALTEAQKTVALDPNAPIYWLTEGTVLYNLRRLEEAEARFLRALELEPEFSSARRRLVRLYLVQDRLAEARQMFRQLELHPARTSVQALRAQLEATAGNRAESLRILATTEDRVLVRDLHTVAAVHLALGDRTAALAALRRAITERAVQPLSFAAPELDPLRATPEFADLLAQMRLPAGSVTAIVGVARQDTAALALPPSPPNLNLASR
jgi:DNA-binding winged helix-turn-helix (wHTH) protein/TolB-like protein/Tfp pilus assembly protein PilF